MLICLGIFEKSLCTIIVTYTQNMNCIFLLLQFMEMCEVPDSNVIPDNVEE